LYNTIRSIFSIWCAFEWNLYHISKFHYRSGVSDQEKAIKIKTCIAKVTIPCNIFAGYKTGELQSVSLVITNGNKSNFSMDVQEQIGQRPVVEIFFRINRQKFSWQNENIPVKVSIAYTPTKEEMEEHEYRNMAYRR
jgi:hypothetical protein